MAEPDRRHVRQLCTSGITVRSTPRDRPAGASGRRARGQSLVEFALVFPIIVLLVVGVRRDRAGRLRLQHDRERGPPGVRVAAVNQLAGRDRLRRVAPDRGPVRAPLVDPRLRDRRRQDARTSRRRTSASPTSPPPSTTLTCTPTLHVGCIATVTVTYDYSVSTPFVSRFIGPITMTPDVGDAGRAGLPMTAPACHRSAQSGEPARRSSSWSARSS